MSVATAELQGLNVAPRESSPPAEAPIRVTERAAHAVKSILNDQRFGLLNDFAPDLVDVYKDFEAKNGRAPLLSELAAASGASDVDVLANIGEAAFSRGEALPNDFREKHRELGSSLGKSPTAAQLADALGLSEKELLARIGKEASAILGRVHLRLRTIGAGCSGMQDKLDLDPEFNEKRDLLFECHGVPVVVDKRSLMYLSGAAVDYVNELNRSGFSISNPNRKSTCGCGSSYSM
jgi:iron-sulfur cluster assembly protein